TILKGILLEINIVALCYFIFTRVFGVDIHVVHTFQHVLLYTFIMTSKKTKTLVAGLG
ncbi:hypothetical protein ACJX0J_036454, partial [Zea mays]